MAAGGQNSFTTKPIRDITDDHLDIVNFTNEYPIDINQFGNSEPLHVTDYYEFFMMTHVFMIMGQMNSQLHLQQNSKALLMDSNAFSTVPI